MQFCFLLKRETFICPTQAVEIERQAFMRTSDRSIVEFVGLLTLDDTDQFLIDFITLEIARTTKVTSVTKGDRVSFTLYNNQPDNYLLLAAFEKGELDRWGWSTKFRRTQ